MKIAILSINTGSYALLWKEYYQSIREKFLPDHEKHFFVWTDSAEIQDSEDITRIELKAEPWPYNTLFRYKYFLQKEQELLGYDYVFYINSNALVEKPLLDKTVGLTSDKELITAKHSWVGADRDWEVDFSSEPNTESKAYIPSRSYEYVWGAFVGGKPRAFFEMCRVINEWTDDDLSRDIIPIWHDESYLNKYRHDNASKFFLIKRCVIDSEGHREIGLEWRYNRRIVLRDKGRYFPSIKTTTCTCWGGFGNQLWCISRKLKEGKEVILNTYKAQHIKDFRKYFKNIKFTTDRMNGMDGACIKLDYLVPKEVIRNIIKEVPAEKHDVVIHWRMGDYKVTPPYDRVIFTKEYIDEALNILGKKPEECVIVTDSPERVKELTDIRVLDIADDLETFWTIVNAENIVMSASTFSWWGAYLSEAKKIVYPKTWAEDLGASAHDSTTVKRGIDVKPDEDRYIVLENCPE